MEFKHSPAPWLARDEFIYSSNGNLLAEIHGYEGDRYLIAAAPELLESLRELVSSMERYEIDVGESAPVKHKEMMNKANSAISKALGQQ
ncbi:hypothetical protein [Providencia stuartii]|uniref:hypothetical protein n=1 Tax=Providencia stuartii TaxID=588 RepID=UPI001BD0B03C|nr:hypothetical protein [Providencia thailandensis]MBS7783754.1 hypothetical protein [Providencia thailandensis]